MVEVDDAPAECVDDLGVVRRHEQRRAELVDANEQLDDLPARDRVEVPCRLVGDEYFRSAHQGARNRRPLLLATRELVREVFAPLREADKREGALGLLPCFFAGVPRDEEREADVLGDRLPWQQLEVLEHDADAPPKLRDRGAAHACAIPKVVPEIVGVLDDSNFGGIRGGH